MNIPYLPPGIIPVSGQTTSSSPLPSPVPQLDRTPSEESEPPVRKKKFVPAATLNEAAFLASRADTDRKAYLKQVKELLGQPGIGLSGVDREGRTPLHWVVIGAIYSDEKLAPVYADLAELLIAGGAAINAKDIYGNTPLDYQYVSPAEEMRELLLENGAQPGIGKNHLAQLETLVGQLSKAADSGDIVQVRAALASNLPLATMIPIKLTTLVSSHTSRAGDPLEAVVAAPINVAGRLVIAPGTKLEGTVLYTHRSTNRFERSQLVLDFVNLINADGTKSQLALNVTEVENSREKVESGRIIGVSYPNNALAQRKVSWGMRLIGMAFPELGYAIEASTLIYAKKFNREIRYEPGTDLSLQVMFPANIAVPANLKGFATFKPSAGLTEIACAVPPRVETTKGQPVDITNVLLIGSQAQVEAAFSAAGWEEPKKLGAKSGLETFSAILFKQGYDRAPFSDLYLGGQPPALSYQKQLNTFAKRNHIRLWKSGTYEGQDVWIGAATHDIGMGISREGDKLHWFHTVDIRVDEERTKVLNDLMFAGGAQSYALVERPEMPLHNLAPGGDPRDTDGKILILKLN